VSQDIDISGRRVLFAMPTIDDRVHASLMGAIISGGSIHPLLFHFEINETGQYVGEDYYFCNLARMHGFRIHIDPLIKTWHCGDKEYEGDFLHHIVLPEQHDRKLVVNS